MRRFAATFVLALLALVMTFTSAHAQTGINGAQQGYNAGTWIGPYNLPNPNTGGAVGDITGINQAMSVIQSDTTQWGSKIFGFAQSLFWSLVVIDICWMGVQHILFKENLGELFASFALKIIAICFYFFFFLQNGGLVVSMIVNSFSIIGTNLGGATSPGGLLSQGLGYASPMIAAAWYFSLIPTGGISLQFGNYGLTTQLVCISAAMMVAGAFAILAAQLLLVTIECYVVATAGLIMTAFTGSKFTLSFGEKFFSYAISVGVKLMMIYLIAELASDMAAAIFPNLLAGTIVTVATGSPFPLMIAGFGAVVLSIVSWNAPAFAASILSGSSSISAGQAISGVAGMIQGAVMAQSGMHQLQSASMTKDSHEHSLHSQQTNQKSENHLGAATAGVMGPAGDNGVGSKFLPGVEEERSAESSGAPSMVASSSSSGANGGAASLNLNTGQGASQLRAQRGISRALNDTNQSLQQLNSNFASTGGGSNSGYANVGSLRPEAAAPSIDASLPGGSSYGSYGGGGSDGGYSSSDSSYDGSYGDDPGFLSSGGSDSTSGANATNEAVSNMNRTSMMNNGGYAAASLSGGSSSRQAPAGNNLPAPDAYAKMSVEQYDATMTEPNINKMTYGQLEAARNTDKFSTLSPDQQKLIENAISQQGLGVKSAADQGMYSMSQGLRSLAPPDQANGGAVSIRLTN